MTHIFTFLKEIAHIGGFIISLSRFENNMLAYQSKTLAMTYQRSNVQNCKGHDDIKAVGRRLHRIKRRILMEVENDGGSPQNNWTRYESSQSRNPFSYLSVQKPIQLLGLD